MSPHFTVRRVLRCLGEIVPVLALACATQIAAAEPTAPVVALAPIVRVDSDARPDESESLTPLLQAGLSDDSRWRMVERARLDLLRAEWAFARDGLADTATALREIRPLGASLLLICRPEPGDLSAPSATCEVIDALTAEPLASARASLTDRPFARWYRNPPPEDIAAITAAFRTALSEALAVRATQSGQQLVTPLFFIGPAELSGQLEAALDARLAAAPDWRPRRALRLDGSRAEALLAASGFTPDGVSTGFHVWGRFTPADAGEPPTELRYWIWNGVGAPEEHLARGDASALSTHILNALEKTPAPGAPASSPTPEIETTRLQLARQMIEEARALARSTGLKHDRFFSRLPADLVHEPLRAQVMRLLAAAAFLAPTDAEAQELWLRTAFSRELSFSVTWGETRPVFNDRPLNAEARRLQRELIAFAETFWRRSDGALDLRLLYLTFRDNPARLAAPDAFAELRRLAAIIGEPSAEEMAPHLGLLSLWLNALWKTCPEYRDREQKFERFRRQPGPPIFDPPPAETLETFETLWPLFRVLRHYPRHYPLNLGYFYPHSSPRAKQLLADEIRLGPRPNPQPLIVSSVEPSLIDRPPPPAPPAPEPLEKPADAPDPDVLRRARERQAFFESIKDKPADEQNRLRLAFLQKQVAEAAASRQAQHPIPPAGPRPPTAAPAPARPERPALDPAAIPGLSPAERNARLRETSSHPDQLDNIRALLGAGADPLDATSERRPPLLVAIEHRQEAYAQAMLDARPDLTRRWTESNSNGPAGVYLAHAALKRGLAAVARRIIDLHPDQVKGVHTRESDSLLGIAIKHGDPALVRHLVRLGAEYSSVADDALIDLARRCARPGQQATGHSLSFDYVREMIHLLRKIEPDAINVLEDDESPLLFAVLARNHELAAELIAAGASVQRGSFLGKSIPDIAATDPVMQRVLRGQPVAQARATPAKGSAIDGADVVAEIAKKGAAALDGLQLTPQLLAYQDAKRWTLLHHALHLKDEARSLRLIAAGSPLEAASIRGQTPLTFAAFNRLPRAVDALLARGANPSGRGDTAAITPLRAAAVNEDLALMRRLIAAGADLDQNLYDDRMPQLCAAIWNGQSLDVIRLLVEAGARLDRTNFAGYGPLEHAIGKNRADVLEYLRGKGAPWSKPTDSPDHTPLRFAVRNNARDAVLFLLRAGERDPGALALATDRDIRALLSDAMQQDTGGKAFSDDELWPVICKDKELWKERVDAHLAAGGNVNHGAMDWTPLMLAINSANPDMVRHLLAKGANPKIHPQRHRNKSPLDLSDVGTLRLAWNLSYGGSFRGENEPAFAEIIKMIAPLEPVRDNQSLFFLVLRERLWLAAEAFRAVGVKPTARMREQIVTEGRLKGADLERALTLLANGP